MTFAESIALMPTLNLSVRALVSIFSLLFVTYLEEKKRIHFVYLIYMLVRRAVNIISTAQW